MSESNRCPSERFDHPHDALTAYMVRMGHKAKPLWLTPLAALLCELPIEEKSFCVYVCHRHLGRPRRSFLFLGEGQR